MRYLGNPPEINMFIYINNQQEGVNGQQEGVNSQQDGVNSQQECVNGQQEGVNSQQEGLNGQQEGLNGQQINQQKDIYVYIVMIYMLTNHKLFEINEEL